MDSSQRRNLLITGANKGIGYVTVEKLISEPAPYDIILTSRDKKLGEQAISTLRVKHPNSKSTLTYYQLDVNDDQSIENLVSWLKESNRKLDVLINNAGVLHRESDDKLKHHTIQTNFFSVVKLTEKLVPLLTEDAKILQISSMLGQLAIQGPTLQKALSDPNLTEKQLYDIANNIIELTKDFTPWGPFSEPSYPASKALLNAYVKNFLPSKVKSNQQVYAIHPGWVKSDMAGDEAPQALEEGADTPVYLVNLPFKKDLELNAKLIGDRKVMVY